MLDVRAQAICNLGPVISGSVRDDHIQGQGLIFTTGEVVIAGLITPAKGDRVTLAYVTPDGGTVARFPRSHFKVTQAFANPLSNQTQVQLANDLAYERGKGGGVVSSNLLDGLNRGVLRTAASMNLREAAALICSRVGITVKSLGTWTINKQIAALNSEDYIETLSEMLASAGHVGYLDAQNELEAIPYANLPTNGPVVTFGQVVDINPNSGGVDFTENPTGTGTAKQTEEEEPPQTLYTPGVHIGEGALGNFTASWDNNGMSTETAVKVTLKNGSTRSFPVTETVITSEQKAEPDNRTLERINETTTAQVKVNSQLVQDYLNTANSLQTSVNQAPPGTDTTGTQLQILQLRQQGNSAATTPVSSRKVDQYEYQRINPPPLTDEEQEQVDQEVESAIDNLIANDELSERPSPVAKYKVVLLPKLPTFRVTLHVATETISYLEALGRIGIKDYTKLSSIPSGEGISSVIRTQYLYGERVVREVKTTYVAYGLTQMGQQAISAAASKLVGQVINPSPLISQFFPLVVEDFEVVTRDVQQEGKEKPVPDYLAPYQNADVVIQGGNRIQVGEQSEQQSEQRPNNSRVFSVPFLPDDVVNDDGSIDAGGAGSSASRYAEEQNRLLLGHRLGLQVTTGLGILPNNPLRPFHLSSNGITATYRLNGTSFAFDANSCMVSTDALYWGLAGGNVNGPRWTPVAPGTTALPTPPAPVVNGPQPPANSITVEDPVDVSDQAAINALLDALPDDEVQVFATELEPVALALPFKPIIETSLQLRLQLEAITVPLGINRLMDSPDLQVRLQLEAVQALSSQVVLELENSEQLQVRLQMEAVQALSPEVVLELQTFAFDLAPGDAVPLAGSGIATSTPAGWTEVFNGNIDDTPLEITGMAFPFLFNGVSYTSFWLSPNGYITFGAGSSQYTGLGNGNPALPKIFINATDDSMQKVFVRSTANTFRVRVEGNTSSSNTGTTYRVYEIAFFKAFAFDSFHVFEVRMGVSPDNTGLFNVYSASAVLNPDPAPVPAANKSWIFSSENSTDWFVVPAFSVIPVE